VLRPKDVFGRLGGEEFVVLLLASSIEAACARAERVRFFRPRLPIRPGMSCHCDGKRRYVSQREIRADA
jgi:GGDEF domain-containing protein